jgi:hypothetical protein
MAARWADGLVASMAGGWAVRKVGSTAAWSELLLVAETAGPWVNYWAAPMASLMAVWSVVRSAALTATSWAETKVGSWELE